MATNNPYEGMVSYTYRFKTMESEHALDCWLEFEGADPDVGAAESWTLAYAEIGGVDIADLLSDSVREDIQIQAQLAYDAFDEPEYEDDL